jgi:hypothetical protein
MIDASIIQSSKQEHGLTEMNRFCVICDSYTPSNNRMFWHKVEGGYCCRQCAINDGLIDQDDE